MIFCRIIESQLKLSVIKEYQFSPDRKFKADYYIPELNLLIEQEGGIYNGKAHGSISGILRDIEKYNLATVLGYKILRFLPAEMITMKPVEAIKNIMKLNNKI